MIYKHTVPEIIEKAKEIRSRIIIMNATVAGGHTGSDLSESDILAALFLRILEIPKTENIEYGKNQFILSKGHGVGGFYATLSVMGLISEKELTTYLSFDSKLPGHPVKKKQSLVNINTGGLGHGLSVGVGIALAKKRAHQPGAVFVLCGDGELQEGSVWEAAMSAAHFNLDNLVVIVDRNRLQLAGKTDVIMNLEPLMNKWQAFGFEIWQINGNDVEKIVKTLEEIDFNNQKPHVVIANTVKGKGVSYMENVPDWHHKYPTGNQITQALKEINE